jgi:voltage-gated potassium channel
MEVRRMPPSPIAPVARRIACQRDSLLRRLEARLELPMALLGLGWLVLLVVELMGREHVALWWAGQVIWALFVLDFVIKMLLAPRKTVFLRRNLLAVVSLLLPALRAVRVLRVFRALRVARATRGLRLLRLLTSLNRGVRSLGRTLQRRGFSYVMALTLLVLLAGAAGMLAFEGEAAGGGLRHYGDALWWTAMLLVTMGSDYWPRSAGGRALCLGLATYGFTMFGYITATLGSYFIAADTRKTDAEPPR